MPEPTPTPDDQNFSKSTLGTRALTVAAVEQAVALLEANDASQAAALLAGLEGVNDTEPDLQKRYYVQLAWANYRCGSNNSPEGIAKYGEALAAAEKAGDDPRAQVCIASVLAQSNTHRDDTRLFGMVDGIDLIANPGLLNAILILGGKGDLTAQWMEIVHDLMKGVYLEQAAPLTGAVFGHILQNYGKIFLNVLKNPTVAQKCFEQALTHYNMDVKTDLPHIGAAFFWIGRTLQAQGNLTAMFAAELASTAFKEKAAGDAYRTDEKIAKSYETVAALKVMLRSVEWLRDVRNRE